MEACGAEHEKMLKLQKKACAECHQPKWSMMSLLNISWMTYKPSVFAEHKHMFPVYQWMYSAVCTLTCEPAYWAENLYTTY